MPIGNNFQHSIYSRADPLDRVEYRELISGAPSDSLAWQDAMADLGSQLVQARVRAVLFLHGTFLGTDLFGLQRLDEAGGLKRGYSRGIPGVDALLALMREGTNGLPALPEGRKPSFKDDDATKTFLDKQVGDAGNYAATYVEQFYKAVNRNAGRSIVCLRMLWSSEHHHLGRALAAVQVINRLKTLCDELTLGTGDRMLVQAHGQAALVLALVSNLLAQADPPGRQGFFQVLKSGMSDQALENIQRAEVLVQTGRVLNGAALDAVTFGTPVRYGWDPSGLGKLLHVVNHRPMRVDGKRWLAKMELPQITMEMPIAWGGDYVQQLAVAGSDAVPTSAQAQAVNKALWELLEPFEGFERWLECARKSVRCQNDGHCLLVDYKDAGSSDPRDHIYGHGAYTRMNAMLFNLDTIQRTFYGS
jgi:hypothetical protein